MHTNSRIKLYSARREKPGLERTEVLWEEVFHCGEAESMIPYISDFTTAGFQNILLICCAPILQSRLCFGYPGFS